MNVRKWIFSAVLTAVLSPPLSSKILCDGYLPENSLRVPLSALHTSGLNKTQFDDILDRIETLYTPEVQRMGGILRVERNWSDATVNAYAFREGRNWWIAMFGGFARFAGMTQDSFAAVACHELGHHLGGAPKFDEDWASAEGQSDYYAATKCLKRLFENDDNAAVVAGMTLDPAAVSACRAEHGARKDQDICIRITMAGLAMGNVYKVLEGSKTDISLLTPDPTVVPVTNTDHPHGQCRVDTHFQGGLCRVGAWQAVSEIDPAIGYCADARAYPQGMRPRCWYAP